MNNLIHVGWVSFAEPNIDSKRKYKMRIISKKALDEFAKRYPDAKEPLARWHGIVKKAKFFNFNVVINID